MTNSICMCRIIDRFFISLIMPCNFVFQYRQNTGDNRSETTAIFSFGVFFMNNQIKLYIIAKYSKKFSNIIFYDYLHFSKMCTKSF